MKIYMKIFSFLFLLSSAFAVPLDGERVFTIQVASLKEKVKAEKVASNLVRKGFKDVWIKHVNDRFRVRIGFFKTKEEALEFTKELDRKNVKGYYVTLVEFTQKDVELMDPFEKEEETEETIQIENRTEEGQGELTSREEVSASDNESKTEPSEETWEKTEERPIGKSRTEDENGTFEVENVVKRETNSTYDEKVGKNNDEKKSNNRLSLKHFLFIFLPLLLLISFFLKRREDKITSFEKYILKLFKEGKCEKLIETALPFLEKDRENTFVRELIAECYMRQSKWLEAASMYKEISEILKGKGLFELSEKMEKKFEEISAKEFIK